jgi:O-antigen/teichoic acid export membrane protein
VQRWFKLRFSFKWVDIPLLKSFVKPSAAFMLIPLGHAISNQGMIFVINTLLGSVILVVFTTTRTLINLLRAMMNLLNYSIEPEVSVAYGKRDFSTITKLYHRSLIITFVSSFCCIILLMLFGKPVYMIWTKYAISFESMFFYGMLAVLLVSCLWNITSIIPLATNTHISFSIAFVVAQLTGVGIISVALIIYPYLAIVPIGLFLAEIFLLYFVMKEVNLLLNSNFAAFRKEIPHEVKFIVKNINRLRFKINK